VEAYSHQTRSKRLLGQAPSPIVKSDSLVEQVAQIEDFASGRIDGRAFFQRNYFTSGLELLVRRGFERPAGKSEDGAFYLTQAMGGGKTHSLIAFGLLAADQLCAERSYSSSRQATNLARPRSSSILVTRTRRPCSGATSPRNSGAGT
jgi:hypothetical protein